MLYILCNEVIVHVKMLVPHEILSSGLGSIYLTLRLTKIVVGLLGSSRRYPVIFLIPIAIYNFDSKNKSI